MNEPAIQAVTRPAAHPALRFECPQASEGRQAAYAYKAARRSGVIESGVVEAASREAALDALAARGLFPIDVRLEVGGDADRSRLPARDLALGLRVLATLVGAGLPIARALAALDELVPASWQAGLPALRDAVRDGQGISGALAASPLDIPPLVLGIVRAGEAGSGLAAAVRRAAEVTEAAAATRAAVRGALAYPVLLACSGVASVALLIGVVLPRFATILGDLGQSLPPTTRFVLDAAAIARAGAVPAVVVLAVLFLVWRAWAGSEEGRVQWHGWLLALPVAGPVRRSAATSRTAAALSALLESGVPIAPALLHASRASGDAALHARLLAARERVLTGERIARALDATAAMTPTAVRLVRAGEETGELAQMLAHAARLEGELAERAVKAAVRLLEPALIMGFGGMVALVAAALLQAVYSVRPTP